jgi:hypothetical protein
LTRKPRSSRHEHRREEVSAFMDLISIAIAMVFFIVMFGVIWALERV